MRGTVYETYALDTALGEEMKRCLLTGGAGFVGRHMLRYLLDHTDWDIVVLDRLDSAAMGWELAELLKASDRCKWVHHDLRAAFSPQLSGKLGEFDYIIHMAAASHVTRSVKEPGEFIQDNVVGMLNLLEWARHQNARLLCFSTDEVYGASETLCTVGDGFYPTNPYAASKAGAELLCPAWANTYGMDIVVTRCTNIYGPGQHEEKFIPLATRAILEGRTLQVHAAKDGTVSSRCYIYVEDVCAATMAVLTRGGRLAGRGTGAYNISGTDVSNLAVAQLLAMNLGHELRFELVTDPPDRPRPDLLYLVDDSATRALGWEPKVRLEEGIRRYLANEKIDVQPLHHAV